MNYSALKYLLIFTGPLTGIISFCSTGWLCFLPVIYVYGLIPVIELFYKGDVKDMSAAEEALALEDRFYDFLLYLMVPVQYGMILLFMITIQDPMIGWLDVVGRTASLGIMCAALGINVAHELGHRSKPFEQTLSKVLLLSSLYMHFFIEHNRGHHAMVATQEDPASARKGELLYTFLIRTVFLSYVSAWKLESKRLTKSGKSALSLNNEMIWFTLIQAAFVGLLYFVFGTFPTLCFVTAACIGFLLLETVNYIEHYGLQRQKKEDGKYRKVLPIHSWNSNHPLGRLMLFELSRHSDHHYKASRKYQVLRHFDDSPQMPTGYPGMIVLSLFPPLWFRIMHPRLEKLQAQYQNDLVVG